MKQSANNPLNVRLIEIAVWLGALCLFIAPFRSSAGLRAAALVVAFLLMLYVAYVGRATYAGLQKYPAVQVPPSLLLRLGVSLWVVTVLTYSLLSPDWRDSLPSMRGDVITPIFAGIVFYGLCRTRNSLAIWLSVLFIGLLILAGMLINDPFQAMGAKHEPAYVTIGWLTTWLVMLAALLPLGWVIPWSKPRLAKVIAITAAVIILTAAWLTVNRMIWLCFGVMFVIYVALNFRRPGQSLLQYIGMILASVVLSIGLFSAASIVRATYYPDAVDSAVTMLKQDDRQLIWKEAIGLIAERPIAGHGYALEAGKQALAARFENPWHRDVYRHPHNIVLNAAIQMGVPGALALLCLFAGLSGAFISRIRRAGNGQASTYSRAVAACGLMLVIGFFIRNMTDDFFSRHASLLLGALVGILLAVSDWDEKVIVEDAANRAH